MPSRWKRVVAASIALGSLAATLKAGDPSPAGAPSLLEQLSSDTQRVYERVRGGIVRVQLPTPQWLAQINRRDQLLRKWGSQLDPQVKVQIGAMTEPGSTTQPTTAPTTQTAQSEIQFPFRNSISNDPGNLILVASGLLLDNDGHIVVPVFGERSAFGDLPLPVVMGDGTRTNAKFLGSDRKTNLTVFQLENHTGTPVEIARARPDDGVLTVVVLPEGGAKLTVWTSLRPEPGVIVMPDGKIAGFGFNGQFLGAAACRPIVDQIIKTGEVHRAKLGMRVREVPKTDTLRQQVPTLAGQSAIRIEEVLSGSVADRAGLRVGDLILAIADDPVGDAPTFAAVIASHTGKTDLKLIRSGAVITVAVELTPVQ